MRRLTLATLYSLTTSSRPISPPYRHAASRSRCHESDRQSQLRTNFFQPRGVSGLFSGYSIRCVNIFANSRSRKSGSNPPQAFDTTSHSQDHPRRQDPQRRQLGKPGRFFSQRSSFGHSFFLENPGCGSCSPSPSSSLRFLTVPLP